MNEADDPIADFLQRYTKQQDYYSAVAAECARQSEHMLDDGAVRSIVSHRAKRAGRLEEKIRARHAENPYTDVATIYEDIVDLAGVRIAVYFPGDMEDVARLIGATFVVVKEKHFGPGHNKATSAKRFSGYRATHFRVHLKPASVPEDRSYYCEALVEIQVASVLMHAWAEVEHDLVYKPLSGALSAAELALIDQVNGLVLAGEIALEQLQKAMNERVAGSRQNFANHYELASLLHTKFGENQHQGLGRPDVLLTLLRLADLDRPERLLPLLDSLEGPIDGHVVPHVVDRLIEQGAVSVEQYQDAMKRHYTANPYQREQPSDEELDLRRSKLGEFLLTWNELRRDLLAESGIVDDGRTPPHVWLRPEFLQSLGFKMEQVSELQHLRQLRNQMAHAVSVPSLAEVEHAVALLRAVLDRHAATSQERDKVG